MKNKEKKDNRQTTDIPKGSFISEEDFMKLFGLWKNRKISLEQIRKKAWR